jgi:hypothetical protein
MNSFAHNKKRNIGIVYELLLRAVSAALVEGDKKRAEKALSILETHFKRDSEIFKEFRVFKAVTQSSLKDVSHASSIISESRAAIRRIDHKKSEREKSLLIRDINHNLSDPDFYNRRIPNYRALALVQTVMAEWKQVDGSDLSRMISLESQVIDYLTESKSQIKDVEVKAGDNVDSLVVKIMNEKFNRRWGDRLSPAQRELLNSYITMTDGSRESFVRNARAIKEAAIKSIDLACQKTDNVILKEGSSRVRNQSESLNVEEVNDDLAMRLLTLTSLVQEVSSI